MHFIFGICVVFLLILLWLHLYISRNFSYWQKHNIPYVKPIPFVGNMYKVFMFKGSIGNVLEEIYNSVNTAYVGFFVLDKPFLLLRDPDLIKRVIIQDFEYFDSRSITANTYDKISSNLLFSLKNPKWKSVRQQLTPVFSSGKIKGMFLHILEASVELKGYITNEARNLKITDSREMSMKYTTDVISSCVFGINARCFQREDAEFRVIARRMFEFTLLRSLSMSACFIAPFLAETLNLKFVEPSASKFLSNVLWKHMNERESSQLPRGDLIDILITLRKTNAFDNGVLLAQPIGFFMAGFETTGTTLTFALYCIAKHPDIQVQLRDEINNVLKRHGSLTYESLQDMKYLDRVINETLRLFPVLPYLDRRCNKSYQFPGTDWVLEKGTPVYISLLGLHYDPQYFPDPYKFDPNRFTEENKAKIPFGVYMPFGEGPRACIGLRMGQVTAKTALVQILTEFEIETCPTTPEPLKFDPKAFLISPDSGRLDLRFKKYLAQAKSL